MIVADPGPLCFWAPRATGATSLVGLQASETSSSSSSRRSAIWETVGVRPSSSESCRRRLAHRHRPLLEDPGQPHVPDPVPEVARSSPRMVGAA